MINSDWEDGREMRCVRWMGVLLMASLAQVAAADSDLPTKFLNQGGVTNTRHNLTQNVAGLNSGVMDPYRNNYGEVCVYCHTPHGANDVVQAPLWNHTATQASYTLYSELGTVTLTGNVTNPGTNSLTCLSCHDGTVAVDSIINMPGSGRYDPAQKTTVSETFLDSWGAVGAGGLGHASLGPDTPSRPGFECATCHQPIAQGGDFGATDFTVMVIGTDLRDDHPIGVNYPTVGPGVDFNETTGVRGNVTFFDDNGNTRPDSNEIRLYDTGQGPEVECASCHDPHGVRSPGSPTFNATFLRVSNNGSGVCLTCHDK